MTYSRLWLPAAGAALLLLAGCGGDDTPLPMAAADEVPGSATASARAWFDTIAGLATSETAEPLSLRQVTAPPMPETGEPLPLR